MKKFKLNVLPIIGMMVAVATLAFTAPKEERIDLLSFGKEVLNPEAPEPTISWIPLENKVENTDYQCVGVTEKCVGEFEEYQIDPQTQLPYPNEDPISESDGSFKLM